MRKLLKRSLILLVSVLITGFVFTVPFLPTAAAGPTFVQGAANRATAFSIGCTLSSTVTAGDSIFTMAYSGAAANVDSWSDGLSGAGQGYGPNSLTINNVAFNLASPSFTSITRVAQGFVEGTGGASDTITYPISGGSSSSNAVVCAEFTGAMAPAANTALSAISQLTGTTATATLALAASATPLASSNLAIIQLLISGCGGIVSYTLPSTFLTAAVTTASVGGTTGCASTWQTEAVLAYSLTYVGGASTFSTSVVSTNSPSVSELYNNISVSFFDLTSNTTTTTIFSTITTTLTVTNTLTVTSTVTLTNTVTSTVTHNFTSTVTSTTTVTSGGGASCTFVTNFTVCFAVSPPGGGSTVPSAQMSGITTGTVISIAATPNAGYVFVQWVSSQPTNTIAAPLLAATTATIHTNGVLTAQFRFTGSGKLYVDLASIILALLLMLSLDCAAYKMKDGGGVFYLASMVVGVFVLGEIFSAGYVIDGASLSQSSNFFILNAVDPNIIAIIVAIATIASAYLIYWDYHN